MTVTNTVPPAITGLARQGQTLATSNGSWTFDLDFLSYAYQWLRCDAAGANCVDIGGATASQYLLTASDVGSTIRSEVTATESAAPAPPPSTGFYGVPIPSDGLANLEIGKTARQVAHRFAASQTGTVVSVRAFLKIDDGNNYSAGNHGTIVVNMYAVDGSGHPTGASLGVTNAVVHPSNGSPTQSVWPLFTFTSPVAVTSGTRYCLVWSNTQFDQATNYCSLNDCDQPALNPRVPYASDADVAVFYRDGAGSWNTDHPERNPIHTLIYGDGEHQGNGYIDYRSGSGLLAVGGSTRARMNITPSSSQTLTDVFLFIKKSGSPSSLTVAVKQGASTVASATILAASVGTSYNWVTEALAVTLTAGINYTWELSATTGTYNIFPYQSGTPQGFTGGLLFEDGYYEFSTNGGSSWSTFSGSTAFDIPIYFTQMAILYVAERGTKVESSLTASMTVTLSATTSINNHLFLILGARAGDTGLGTNPISSIADGRGNSWSVNSFGWNDSENSIVAIASCLIATPNQAGDTLTIDFTHAVGAGRAATLQEFSGIRSADQAGAASNPSSVDVSVSTNMSTDTADELVLMSATGSGTGTPWTVGVNYLEFTTKAQSDGVRTHYGEYRIVAATAIQTATATMPAPNTGWTAAIATFRASTPGPEDNPPIGFLGRGAGWQMAFPTIPTTGANTLLSSTTSPASLTHTFPNLTTLAPAAGDLLLAVIVQYQGGTLNAEYSSWGASFLETLDDAAASGTGNGALGVARKVATGSESGTFTVTSAHSFKSTQFLMRIPAATWHGTTIPEVQAATRAAGAAADPGSFSPSWGAEDTLWISVAGQTETSTTGSPPTLTASPTNYSGDLIVARVADAVGDITSGVGFRQLNASSDDVGTWTGTNLIRGNGIATVIAVRPATAAPALSRDPWPWMQAVSRSNVR